MNLGANMNSLDVAELHIDDIIVKTLQEEGYLNEESLRATYFTGSSDVTEAREWLNKEVDCKRNIRVR